MAASNSSSVASKATSSHQASQTYEPFSSRRLTHLDAQCGALYDIRTEHVTNQPLPLWQRKTRNDYTENTVKCTLEKMVKSERVNPLILFNLHSELRLSVASTLTKAKGIAEVIHYPHAINEYTRILSYSTRSRTEYLPNEYFETLSSKSLTESEITGTHVIISIEHGIDARIILQLPEDETQVEQIDSILDKISNFLNSQHTIQLTPDEEKILKENLRMKIFANVSQLTKIKSLVEFYQQINEFRSATSNHQPYNFKLCPVTQLVNVSHSKKSQCREIPAGLTSSYEFPLLNIFRQVDRSRQLIAQDYPHSKKNLKQFEEMIKTDHEKLKRLEEKMLEPMKQWIISVRSCRSPKQSIDEIMNQENVKEWEKNMDAFYNEQLKRNDKEHLLGELNQRKIEYRSSKDHDISVNDDLQRIREKLSLGENEICCIFGNDDLYHQRKAEFQELFDQYVTEKTEKKNLKFFYIDFSYDAVQLDQFRKVVAKIEPSLTNQDKDRSDEIINILLVGESGTGKSTFINALVNYLRFDGFPDLIKDEPVVLLPVSFMVTTGPNFKEHQVTYDGIDSLSHENHDEHDQSVTQYCRSYLFTNKKYPNRIRIIDTPGFGDDRGLLQDEKNMEHILNFINNLGKLHAVCMMTRSNMARLTINVRLCLSRLMELLDDNRRDLVLFCFTHARSTFFTSGESGSLIKTFLKSVSDSPIKFSKENTFCFDSESFRYWVAVKKVCEIETTEAEQCKETWVRSSKEAHRLLSYIIQQMKPCSISHDPSSIGSLKLHIHLLVRPIMETMRNLLRNIILLETSTKKIRIQMLPHIITDYSTICHQCPLLIHQFNEILVPRESVHGFQNTCITCSCPASAHTVIDHRLEYKVIDSSSLTDNVSDLRSQLSNLCEESAIFSQFVCNGKYELGRDRMLSYLNRMIEEEEKVKSSYLTSSLSNQKLVNELKELKRNYRQNLTKIRTQIDISTVMEIVTMVRNDKNIGRQMDAIEKWQKFIVEKSEYVVQQ